MAHIERSVHDSAGATDSASASVHLARQVHESSGWSDSVTATTLRQVVREVIATPATSEDFQALLRLLQRAQEQHLNRAQIQEQVADTPFDSLRTRLSSTGTANLLSLLNLIVAALALVTAMHAGSPTSTPTITPQQVEEIVERVVDEVTPDTPPPAGTSGVHHGLKPE